MGSHRYLLTRDRHLIGYSVGNFGKNLLLGSVDVTLLFLLTDLLGVPAQQVSVLMAVVFCGDLLLDLGAGLLASRAQHSGIGYRRLIVLGTLPCALAFALIFSLPLLGHASLALSGAAILLFRAAYAVIDVPHNSLLARITSDSRARGRASGYRTVFSSAAGVVIATVVVPLVGGAGQHAQPGQHAAPGQLAWLGMAGGLLFCGAMLLAAWSSREELDAAGAPGAGARRPAGAVFLPRLDRLFAAMALIAGVTGFATPVFGKMMLYVATYAWHQPALAGRVLFMLTLGQFAGAVWWIFMIRHHDKTRLLAVSHGVALGGIALCALADARPAPLLAAAAVTGVGFGGIFMLPWGILADVIDFAEFRHRERRETATFATVLVILKAGAAASSAAIGWTLGALGYVPGLAQSLSVVRGMQVLAFGVPALGSVLAVLTLRRLAIGHQAHARVLRANQLRRARPGP
ncbi:GPH family glycoside/pentoside/hexuronide:cation symporter [Duganella sp. 1224]|uniref:MFS transporter n=1 Tax=Duganella sp. 1224 TaxID=2587052 RepID=UPI0015CE098E|nr:MFS transporter [Duganella sp. 1224]NYE61523.1 GPH family glycoside/pentoside/hexuronide:cation symporter [Duganella sp. 1224]